MYKIAKQSKNWIISLVVIISFSILFSVPSFRAGFSGYIRKLIFLPVNFLSDIEDRLKNKKKIIYENDLLKSRIGSLSLEIEKYKDLNDENSRLRELLGLKDKLSYETVSAEVIARNPNNWIGSFYIDKGTKDGIKDGSAVFSLEGLLGKVTEAGEDSSSVMLITHPGFKTGGMLSDSRTNGIIVGAGMQKVKMLYLPIESNIDVGEEVVTSGLSSIFPKGIVIGNVVSINKSRTGLYKWATIKPAADPYVQEEVLCIKE